MSFPLILCPLVQGLYLGPGGGIISPCFAGGVSGWRLSLCSWSLVCSPAFGPVFWTELGPTWKPCFLLLLNAGLVHHFYLVFSVDGPCHQPVFAHYVCPQLQAHLPVWISLVLAAHWTWEVELVVWRYMTTYLAGSWVYPWLCAPVNCYSGCWQNAWCGYFSNHLVKNSCILKVSKLYLKSIFK